MYLRNGNAPKKHRFPYCITDAKTKTKQKIDIINVKSLKVLIISSFTALRLVLI